MSVKVDARKYIKSPGFLTLMLPILENFKSASITPLASTSKKIGMCQEKKLRNILFETFPCGIIEDTSCRPRSMDIRLTLPKCSIFEKCVVYIESKNIGCANVSGPELKKFERDHSALKDADAAILIARRRVDVKNGFSVPVPGVPNLFRTSKSQFYIDHMDSGALLVAIMTTWASKKIDVVECHIEILPIINQLVGLAAGALDMQNKLISDLFEPLRNFMSSWFRNTRSLAQCLVDVREVTNGKVEVENVFAALAYKGLESSVKRRRF